MELNCNWAVGSTALWQPSFGVIVGQGSSDKNGYMNVVMGSYSELGENCNRCIAIGNEIAIPDNCESLTIIGHNIGFEKDILDPGKTIIPPDCPRKNAVYIGDDVFIQYKGKFTNLTKLLESLEK